MLKVKNIKKSFGGVQAIKGSQFVVESGKVTALIGPNGAGKTTLFNIINGLIRPDEGYVVFDGVDITKKSSFEIANLGISRTFQQVRLFQYLSILDHLRMVDDNDDMKLFKNVFFREKIDTEQYEHILQDVGINRGLDTLVSELSYGQRKLLQIAMALKKEHTLLMFDEPVAGVNKVLQEDIERQLLALKEQGETMLIIDHDIAFIQKLADHIIVLDAGVVLLEGTPGKVLNDARVLEAYLGE